MEYSDVSEVRIASIIRAITHVHGVTSQKALIFILSAVRT
jgi:hypothetical protein